MKLPPLVALRAFVHVGRTRSIRRAAEEIHVDHSVISRHLRNLEERLAVKLIRQDGRGIELTDVGARYYERVAAAFAEISAATGDLTPDGANSFHVYSAPGFAHRLLLPEMPSLQALTPNWSIVLHSLLDRAEAPPEETFAEVLFQTRKVARPGVRSECIAQPRLFPVVNPRVRASWLEAREPKDLLELPIIHSETGALWIPWFQSVGVAPLRLKGPKLPNTHLALEAARFGQGIALANEILVRNDLRNGDLVELLDTDVRLEGYFIAAPEALWDRDPVRSFRLWLQRLLSPGSSASTL